MQAEERKTSIKGRGDMVKELMGKLQAQVLGLGAYRAEVVNVADISVDTSFRSLCEIGRAHV